MTKVSNTPLRILMIAPTSFFSDYGGHIRIYEETLALQRLGHQVTIVTYYKGRDIDGLDIRRTPPLPYRTDYEVGSSRHKLAFDALLAWQALRVAISVRPHIIHGHMHEGALIGAVLARLLRKPLLFDFQGSLTAEMVDHRFLDPQGRPYQLMRRLERKIDRSADLILTSSHQASRLLEAEFDVPPKQILALPDCVDTTKFNPDLYPKEAQHLLREQLGIDAGRTIISYLGLLADYQGTHHLVQAARLLKEWGKPTHFLIMGYPNMPYYREMAQRLNVEDCVTFTGKVRYDHAPFFLSLGDISVTAKMSRTEGSGKLLNYMALAQPIVAYDTPVHREYLGELGCYAPAGDVEALAAKIAELADNPAKQRQLGAQLRLRAERCYSWHAAADKIDGVYQRLNRANG